MLQSTGPVERLLVGAMMFLFVAMVHLPGAWGAVNAVAYYTDHVRSGAEERLDAAWFGAGRALKEKAWTRASALVG
jgi:hypothetical protein